MIKPDYGGNTHRRLLPWILLTVGLAMTAFLTVRLARWDEAGSQFAFESFADQTVSSLEEPVRALMPFLHSASLLVSTNSWTVVARQTRALADEVLLKPDGSGILAIALVDKTNSERGRAADSRRGGASAPSGAGVDHYVVAGVSLLDSRLPGLRGVDLGSDPGFRRTLDLACDAGGVMPLSRPVRLRNGTTNVPVVYLVHPIFRGGKTPALLAARRAELRGFVLLAFLPGERLDSALDSRTRSRVRILVFDDPERVEAHQVCDLGEREVASREMRLETVRPMNVAGCRWAVVIQSPGHFGVNHGLVLWMPILGTILSVLLYWGTRRLGQLWQGFSPGLESMFGVKRGTGLSSAACCDLVRGLSMDGMLAVDGRANILSANPAAVALFGGVEHELTGKPVAAFLPELEKHPDFQSMLRSPSGLTVSEVPVVGRRKNGGSLSLEIAMGTLGTGEERLIFILLRDATLRQRTLDSLAHVQRTQIIGSLTSGIAHDLNNVFTAIISHLELALATREGQSTVENLEYARTSAQRGAELVARLLLFSRHRTPEDHLVNLADLVNQTLTLLRRSITRRIEIISNLDPAAWPVNGDDALIQQVLVILCLNARDAMPRGGRITVELLNVTLSPSGTAPRRAGMFVCLTVIDNGSGMEREVRDRLFEPFFTTKGAGQGTGLGLWTARHIVDRHQGWLEVESEPGKGCRFHVFLPRSDRAPSSVASAPVIERAKTNGEGHEVILVTDDDPMVRNLVRAVLGYRGYRVIEAEDGVEAVETIKSEPVELVFLDLDMPRKDGWQALKEIRALKPAVPVLLCSGTGLSGELLARAKAEGADNVLEKPFANNDLLKIVRNVLDGRQAGAKTKPDTASSLTDPPVSA
jgi:PAS domain S-box-containing protein